MVTKCKSSIASLLGIALATTKSGVKFHLRVGSLLALWTMLMGSKTSSV